MVRDQARRGDARRGILPPSEQRPNSLAQAWSRTCAFDPRMQLSVGRRRSAGEFIGEQDLPPLRTDLLTALERWFIDDKDLAMGTPGHKAGRSSQRGPRSPRGYVLRFRLVVIPCKNCPSAR